MAIGGVLLCIGDSLTFGARDEKGLHYPELLARRMSKEFNQYWSALNEGISGQTTAEILRRCLRHVLSTPSASEVFLWAGFNDAKENVGTSPGDYMDNMESMVRSILFQGKACYLFDIPPMEGFGAPDFVRNDLIDAYNKKIELLWSTYAGKRLYPVRVRDIPGKFRNDGVHLTHNGNHWVADRALDAVLAARQR